MSTNRHDDWDDDDDEDDDWDDEEQEDDDWDDGGCDDDDWDDDDEDVDGELAPRESAAQTADSFFYPFAPALLFLFAPLFLVLL